MKIYTRTGDEGGTALFGGGRVSKAELRVEAYGTVDELNAVLGWAVTQVADESIRGRLEVVQHDLFSLGANLATPPPAEGRQRPTTPPLPEGRVQEMEGWIDELAIVQRRWKSRRRLERTLLAEVARGRITPQRAGDLRRHPLRALGWLAGRAVRSIAGGAMCGAGMA